MTGQRRWQPIWARVRGALFVIAVAVIVATFGWYFPVWFPDVAARGAASDRWNGWLQVVVFGACILVLLARTRQWKWLDRGVTWAFIGIVCLYQTIVSGFEGWPFFQTINWTWSFRFVIGGAGIVLLFSLVGSELLRLWRRVRRWWRNRR